MTVALTLMFVLAMWAMAWLALRYGYAVGRVEGYGDGYIAGERAAPAPKSVSQREWTGLN